MENSRKKALIISLGGSPEPLVKSISHYRPSYVCFYASQGTFEKIADVRSGLGDLAASIQFEIVVVEDENDLVHCYEKAMEAVEHPLRKGIGKKEVIVDYTGGTKNMSVALALATIDHGYSYSYVGGVRRTKGGVGIVESGQEKVFNNVNPWDLLAKKERTRFSTLFNVCRFNDAIDILQELNSKVTALQATYGYLRFLVEGYFFWDLFRHAEAKDRFGRARLEILAESSDRGIRKFAEESRRAFSFLCDLLDCSGNGRKPCRPMILDLIANADRRHSEGKFDDAILRLYRVLEMVAQERLFAAHGISTSQVPIEKVPQDRRDYYRDRYTNTRTGIIQIPQNAAFELLRDLGDPLGEGFFRREDQFRKIQSARNASYLAHGFSSSQEATLLEFREFLCTLIDVGENEIPRFPEIRLE